MPQLRGSSGPWPWRHSPTSSHATSRGRDDDRVIHTGFAALDAILGPGGLPKSASVAIRGDGSSGRTTLSLRVAAEAQAQGSVVAWLDLSRSFDPVEAVARGIRLEWLVVITPASLDEGLSIAGSLLSGRSVDMLVLDLPGGRLARTDKPARIADRLHRLAALARRAETLLLILDAPGLAGGLATAVAESTGIRLELARRSWVRLGRDVVGQRTEAIVAHNRHGPPGRRATLRILYADGAANGMRVSRTTPSSSTRRRVHRHPSTSRSRPPIERPTTMRRLHLFIPHLPLHLARARRSEPFPTGPLVLGGRPWDPGPVIDADPTARALGVRRGMPLGSAHRLVPEATFIEPDPDADRAMAEAAFEALGAFSPSLAGSGDPLDAAFGLFEMGIDGLGPLWGPEPVLIERVSAALRAALPGEPTPRAGVAGTHFAATIAAVHARAGSPVVVAPGDEPAFLAPYPSGLLTTDLDVRARLTRFGLRRDRRRGGAAPVGVDRPVRGRGRPAARPGPRRGDRAVPGAPRPGAPGPRPAHRAAGRGPRAAAVRAPPARGRDHGPAHDPGTRRGPRAC